MDQRSRLIRPEEDHSSSSSGAERTQSRYKPLAPKQPAALGSSDTSPTVEEDEQPPAPDLTFVNVTDPLQSKSQESRKLVRTQVMKNFAREQKKHKGRTEANDLAGGRRVSPVGRHSIDPLSNPQRVMISTTSSLSRPGSGTSRPSASILGDVLGEKPIRSRSLPSAQERASKSSKLSESGSLSSLTGSLSWPLPMTPQNLELRNHYSSRNFRASNPLYMISLLANRPGGGKYPLFIDIDSTDVLSGPDLGQSVFRQLAQTSASLGHALLMVSASDLALRQVNKATNERQVIYHKSQALALLNEAIQDVPASSSLEILATAAVLASHELVVGDYQAWTVHILGFSRMIELNGGISCLSQDNAIRQLILWSDQIGALFMNMRPLFPAAAIFSSSFKLFPNLTQPLKDEYHRQGPHGILAFHRLQQEGKFSDHLVEILEDVTFIAVVGTKAIMDRTSITLANMVELRDCIIHRLLYLSPQSQDSDDEYSFEECVRLTALLLTFDRLFSPVLPSAYFQITHMVADRLAAAIWGHELALDWAAHEWVALWVCFIGTSVSSNNPRTRSSFVSAAAPLCRQMFTSSAQMEKDLNLGMSAFVRAPQLYGSEMVEAFATDVGNELKMGTYQGASF